MAREAGFVEWLINDTATNGRWWIEAHEPDDSLERFAALVAAAEREACAKVCDDREYANVYGFRECAAAIRARGNKDE
jgi:hypothetical protein